MKTSSFWRWRTIIWAALNADLRSSTSSRKWCGSTTFVPSIKLQFRDVENFVHKDFVDRADFRYVKKTLDTRLTDDEYATLVKAIRQSGCIATATPFDERSVHLCVELGLPIFKVASSDMNDWLLLERIAEDEEAGGGFDWRIVAEGYGRHRDILRQPQYTAGD